MLLDRPEACQADNVMEEHANAPLEAGTQGWHAREALNAALEASVREHLSEIHARAGASPRARPLVQRRLSQLRRAKTVSKSEMTERVGISLPSGPA